jgi:glycyl-tRNA synthetase beta chain
MTSVSVTTAATLPAADLLLEIGVEELPSSFVAAALAALPDLARQELTRLRLAHGNVQALGTPRRLALLVTGLAAHQPNLEEELVGPPVTAAFRDGVPTKAAEAFAQKAGCTVESLRRVSTPKGEYLTATRREQGAPTTILLPKLLQDLCAKVPFRKSMRWGDGDATFGRPIQWLLALYGEESIPVQFAGVSASRHSFGHRFLAPAALTIGRANSYVDQLRAAHVLVDVEERQSLMLTRLEAAASQAGAKMIPDAFLVGENLSMVEEPHVLLGNFEDRFLELPERVILEVAKGHQRYFGLRSAAGRLLPHYLCVANTAERPDLIVAGNDRVMRARLADAQFFYREDLKVSLESRRGKLAGIVFQKRLGSVLEKVERIEGLTAKLADMLSVSADVRAAALEGARLCKCDLVALMVGEFPELQGEMGRAYAIAQGVDLPAADVIRDHYAPRGAADATPSSQAAALVALADRLDTLVGCYGVGLHPTGTADPYALRRACLGILRIILAHEFDLSLRSLFQETARAFGEGPAPKALDLQADDLLARLSDFTTDRLRGLLTDAAQEGLPGDTVAAALALSSDRPLDARARARALAALDAETRSSLGEVFKRASNIARQAAESASSTQSSTTHAGDATLPALDAARSEPIEFEMQDALRALQGKVTSASQSRDYAVALSAIAGFAPLLSRYFEGVMVMAEDATLRAQRVQAMQAVSHICGQVARLELLAG